MLFSATLSHRVMELAYEHMDNPEELKTETTQVTADKVVQSLYQPASEEKIPLLLGLLRDLEPPRSMVFVNTKRAAERIESYLVGNDIVCGLLSGDVRQNKRQKILADFTAGKIPVLIATDVAARGLHIDDVTHVFNYDLPQQAEDYVHRIGRTARAGTEGVAVSFACENYSFSLPEIQAYIGQGIPLAPITDELLVKPKRPARIERDRVERPGERGRGAGPRGAGPRGEARGGGSRGDGSRGGGSRGAGRGPDGGGSRGRARPDGGADGAPRGARRDPAASTGPGGNGPSAPGPDTGGSESAGRAAGRAAGQATDQAAARAADQVAGQTAAAPAGTASADGAAPKRRRRRRRGRKPSGDGAAASPLTVSDPPPGEGD